MKRFSGLKPPAAVSDAEAVRQVKAWEDEATELALRHLADTDWVLDDFEAARQGVVFESVVDSDSPRGRHVGTEQALAMVTAN